MRIWLTYSKITLKIKLFISRVIERNSTSRSPDAIYNIQNFENQLIGAKIKNDYYVSMHLDWKKTVRNLNEKLKATILLMESRDAYESLGIILISNKS